MTVPLGSARLTTVPLSWRLSRLGAAPDTTVLLAWRRPDQVVASLSRCTVPLTPQFLASHVPVAPQRVAHVATSGSYLLQGLARVPTFPFKEHVPRTRYFGMEYVHFGLVPPW